MNDQQTKLTTQVVIIGAGPTGLSMAAQLLRYNIDFIILEKNERTTHLSKAIAVQARTLEIFDEIDLAGKAIEEGQVITGANLFYKGKRKALINLSGLGTGLSSFPFALSLEQSKTEKLLADHLTDQGMKIMWSTEFTHFVQDNKSAEVYFRYKDGEEQVIHTSYLVGCDGAGSKLRHQLDLNFQGDTIPKIFYVADVVLKSSVINRNELYMFMIRKGFVLFFPMEGSDHYRVIGILPDTEDLNEYFTFDDIKDTIREHVKVSLEFVKEIWFSSYKVHSRKATSFQKGRCFIAGDAAHIHTPAGGQGMNTGIQDVYNLAWKLAFTLNGKINNDVLLTYDLERSENARHLLRSTDRMFDIMAGVNPLMNFIRLNIFTRILKMITSRAFVKRRIFPLISQTGIKYDQNILTIKSSIGKVQSGVRIPFFVFPGGKHIFEYLKEPNFKLLFFSRTKQNAIIDFTDIKIKPVFLFFDYIPSSLFGNHSDFYILLRPDNHISYIGKEVGKCFQILKVSV